MRAFFAIPPKRGGLPLRQRVLAYHLALALLLLMCLLPLLYVLKLLPSPAKTIEDALDSYLFNYKKSVSLQLSNTAASGLQLSQELADTIGRLLEQNNATPADVSDNPELIAKLEYGVALRLRQALMESRCSGAFVILDATVNSSLPQAGHSRAGVYLKLANTSMPNPVHLPIFWLRGIPAIAEQMHIECHNKWDLEFDVARLPFYNELLQAADTPLNRRYFFSEAHYLRETWEKALLLCVPMRGKDGTVYGICGLEISGLLFKLAHSLLPVPLPGIRGMFAPSRQDATGKVLLDAGAGFQSGPALTGRENTPLYTVTHGTSYNLYEDGESSFVGKEQAIAPSPLFLPTQATKWVVAAMLPRERERAIRLRAYATTGALLALSAGIALILSIVLTRRYSAPVLQGLANIREGRKTSTTVQEIDSLMDFLKDREQNLLRQQEQQRTDVSSRTEDPAPQADISAYRLFIRQIKTLTKAERLVFELYIQGNSSREIATNLNLSINTIRTHNRNIYSKLNVSSYKEMMVYIQMMTGNTPPESFH